MGFQRKQYQVCYIDLIIFVMTHKKIGFGLQNLTRNTKIWYKVKFSLVFGFPVRVHDMKQINKSIMIQF